MTRDISSVTSIPTVPNTARSARCQKGSESMSSPSMSKMAARNMDGRLEAGAEEELGALHVQVVEEGLVDVAEFQLHVGLRVAQTHGEILAPAILDVRVPVEELPFRVVHVDELELVHAPRDPP